MGAGSGRACKPQNCGAALPTECTVSGILRSLLRMAGLESRASCRAREPRAQALRSTIPGGVSRPEAGWQCSFDCLGDRECSVHLCDGGQDGSVASILLAKVPSCLCFELFGLAVVSRRVPGSVIGPPTVGGFPVDGGS